MLITPCGQSTGSHEDYEPHALPCAGGGGGKDRFVPSSQDTLAWQEHGSAGGGGKHIMDRNVQSGVNLPVHNIYLTNR